METSLTTLSPELQAKLDRDRSRGGNQYPAIPVIRLANVDQTQCAEGEYFVEIKKKDERPEIKKLGKNPELIVLYKTCTYSYFDKSIGENGELAAWTSDIHGYGDNNLVMYVKNDGKVSIDFDGTYNEFKKYRTKFDVQNPATGLKTGSLLTFKHVLYVLFEDKVYKMFVSNASAGGIQPDGKLSFDKAQRFSMQFFTDAQWNSQQALYDVAVTMGSKLARRKKQIEDESGKKQDDPSDNDPEVIYATVLKPFWLMMFQSIRTLEPQELAKAVEASMNTESGIKTIDEMRKMTVMEEQSKVTSDMAHEVFATETVATLD